jgi:hypothetical protein
MQELNSIVAVYESPAEAVQGVSDLQKAGFNLMKLSLAAKEYPDSEHLIGCCSTGSQVKYWGKTGALLDESGAFWMGAALFLLPGLGPIVMAGPLIASVMANLEGAAAARGLGVFGSGLVRLGIPKESVFRYESELGADRLLLIAHGAIDELMRARDVLHVTRPLELNMHFEAPATPKVCHR